MAIIRQRSPSLRSCSKSVKLLQIKKKIAEVFGKRGTSFTQYLFILPERSFRNSRLSSWNWRAVIKRIRCGAKNGSMRYFPWITPNCRCLCRVSSNELQSLPLLYLSGTKWAVIGWFSVPNTKVRTAWLRGVLSSSIQFSRDITNILLTTFPRSIL